MDGERAPEKAFVSRSAVDQARQSAETAADRADVVIEAIEDVDRMQEAVELLSRVWGADRRDPPIRRDMMRALAHAGNFVVGATARSELVGVAVGFLGRHGGELVLHSHILGVVEGMRGRSVGFALKQHQRWWSLARSLEHVTWTFDPLVRRNANFNVNKLGAGIVAYHPNFYGPMDDGINAGDESDRCVVWWALLDEHVVRAADGDPDQPGAEPPPGSAVVLDAGGDGWPQLPAAGAGTAGGGTGLAAWVPADIVQMRRQEPAMAQAWRRALRTVLADALGGGHRIVGITRSGWYLLEQAEGLRR